MSDQILIDALYEIACFSDEDANKRLADTGSYGLFDSPHSVRLAREALYKSGAVHEQKGLTP